MTEEGLIARLMRRDAYQERLQYQALTIVRKLLAGEDVTIIAPTGEARKLRSEVNRILATIDANGKEPMQ